MKSKMSLLVLAAALCTVAAPRASAQFGFSPIKRPNIANIFHPVMGAGTVYEETDKDGKKSNMEMAVVDKEMVGTQQAYWVEFGHAMDESGTLTYGKVLVTPADFKFHKMIFVMPNSSQPMEMDMDAKAHNHLEEEAEKWHLVGTETVTVPAGTFSCEHWKKDDGKGDVWASSKVSPMGMVKSVENDRTMLLVKQVTGAKSHITGTPVKFDPQMMMRQRMQQRAEHDKQP